MSAEWGLAVLGLNFGREDLHSTFSICLSITSETSAKEKEFSFLGQHIFFTIHISVVCVILLISLSMELQSSCLQPCLDQYSTSRLTEKHVHSLSYLGNHLLCSMHYQISSDRLRSSHSVRPDSVRRRDCESVLRKQSGQPTIR